MNLNKNIIFIFMIIFLLSLNFIVAKDVNETDLNYESFESDYDNLISIDNTNFQDNTNLNQNNLQTTNSSESSNVLSNENTDNISLNSVDEFKHIYVSPNGTGNGSDKDNSGNFITTLPNTESNTIIHMLDGNYSITTSINLQNWNRDNITIIADNPGQVTIYSNVTTMNFYMFSNMQKVNNIKFENIIFSLYGSAGTQYFFYTSKDQIINISFENCSFIASNNIKSQVIRFGKTKHNIIINNCYFSTYAGAVDSAGTVLINNTNFKINIPENETTTNPPINVAKNGKITVVNSSFISSNDYFTLATVKNLGSFTFENNNLNRHYSFKSEGGKFTPHTTLTFLNGEESVTVGENSNFLINASLVDDYGNIIILPNIKCTIFGQERTLSYSDGVYQTTITTPDILDTYYIDGVDDFIDTYLSDCTIIKPDIVVKHSHNITLNTSDIMYGESANVNITVSNLESGNITYTVKSGNNIIEEDTKEFSNNSVSIVLPNLDVGTYTVSATVLATEEYGETTVSRTFTVNRVTPNISVIVNNVTTLDNVTVNVTVPEGVTGQILIQIGEVYTGGSNNRIVDDKTVQVKSGDSVIITYAPFAAKDTYALGWSFTSNNTNYNSVSNNNWDTGEGRAKLIKFEVVKADSNLTVKAEDVDWGNNVTVSIITDSRFTGNITVKLGDEEKVAEIKEGSGNVSFANLKADTYNITAKFNETDLFTASQKDINVTVNKVNSTLTLGDDIVFDWDKTGSTTVSYSGATDVEAVIVETGAIVPIQDNAITVSNLKAGNYTLRVTTVPDENHTSVTKEVSIKVNKVNSTLTLGDDIVFDWGNSNSTTVSYSGATDVEAVIVETGAIVPVQGNTITVSNLKADTYTLRVTTVTDENHTQTTKTVTIKVNKVNSTLTLGDDIVFDWGNSNSTTVSFTGAVNVEAVVVGRQASVETKDGIITVSALDAGDYTLNVTTIPDENHTSVSKTVNIKVNKVDSDISIMNPVDYVYGNVGQCSVLSQGVINFTAVIVDHPEANITIDNGIVNVSGLKVGNYTLRVTANPDRNHNSVFRECNVTVKMAEVPADQALNITAPANSQSPTFSINLDSSAEGNFTVYVDGKEWETVKVVNGSASITLANLPAGNHKITTSYSGDDNHAAIVQNTTLAITAPAKTTDTTTPAKTTTKITLTLKKVKVKRSAKKLVISATLKINGKVAKGKWLKFKFNKKTYKAKTNKKGVAKITVKKAVLKKLKAGKKVKYQVTYGKKTVKKTVKVKK